MKDLNRRLLPAVIAVILVIFLSQWKIGLSLIILLCGLGCIYELYKLALKIHPSKSMLWLIVSIGTAIYVLYSILHLSFPHTIQNIAWTPTYLWSPWIYILGLLVMTKGTWTSSSLPVIMVFYPLLGIVSIMQLVLLSPEYDFLPLLFLLLNVWAADAFAYFGGSLIGGKKLAPGISPGKTISGWISGLVGVILVSIIFTRYHYDWSLVTTFWWALIIWLSSTLGDLFESRIKRLAQVKDSGLFLPGHGGFLDRLDSVIYAAPFALYIFKVL